MQKGLHFACTFKNERKQAKQAISQNATKMQSFLHFETILSIYKSVSYV
jgi:hypothetical protein